MSSLHLEPEQILAIEEIPIEVTNEFVEERIKKILT
jgi:hypothetical protein